MCGCHLLDFLKMVQNCKITEPVACHIWKHITLSSTTYGFGSLHNRNKHCKKDTISDKRKSEKVDLYVYVVWTHRPLFNGNIFDLS